jgi:hypothetical protein
MLVAVVAVVLMALLDLAVLVVAVLVLQVRVEQLQQVVLIPAAVGEVEVLAQVEQLAHQAAPVSSSSNTVYRHNPFMSSVDQPLGLLLQVQHRWIIWWSLAEAEAVDAQVVEVVLVGFVPAQHYPLLLAATTPLPLVAAALQVLLTVQMAVMAVILYLARSPPRAVGVVVLLGTLHKQMAQQEGRAAAGLPVRHQPVLAALEIPHPHHRVKELLAETELQDRLIAVVAVEVRP